MSRALLFLHMSSPGAETSKMISALLHLVSGQGGWNFQGWPALLSFHKWRSQGSWTSSMAAAAFPQSKHSEREEVWEHLVPGDAGMDTGTASHFHILLISCVPQLAQIPAQGTQIPLVKGSKVKENVHLLSLTWHKMCWKGHQGPRKGVGNQSGRGL